MTTYEAALSRMPRLIFAGELGSLPTRPRRSQSHEKIGASVRMKIEFTVWNHPAGNSKPRYESRVYRSAKRLSDEPACLNAAQKKRTNAARMKMTLIFFISSRVHRIL